VCRDGIEAFRPPILFFFLLIDSGFRICTFCAEQKSKEYVGFLEAFLRKAVTNTKTDDVRKLSSTLSVIANEKQRAVNAKDKGKKREFFF
jgi:hypothetical protein